jgi:hypothetical protein
VIAITGRVHNPDRTEVTLAITMPVEDWEKVCKYFDPSTETPVFNLRRGIRNVLDQVRAVARETLEGF